MLQDRVPVDLQRLAREVTAELVPRALTIRVYAVVGRDGVRYTGNELQLQVQLKNCS